MDSFTQIVLGGAIGNAVAGNKLKNKAVLYGAIAGTIPDLDTLAILFTDPLTAVEIHRGFTHSLIFTILGGFLFGYLMYRIEKKNNITMEECFWLFFWGLFTHSLLDIFTTWGTHILWPFNYSFAFKSIFVIDPLYTLPFVFCLYKSMREKENLKLRRLWNKRGLLISSGYLFITLLLKALVFYSFTHELDNQRIKYNSLSVRPTVMNTILWNGTVETDHSYLIGQYSFFDESPITFKEFPKNMEMVKGLENHQLITRLVNISEGQYTYSEQNGSVYFNDLRFGLLNSDENNIQFAFSYRFTVDKNGELAVEEVQKKREDGFKLLKKLWYRLQGI
ncbi:MAG: metal-dependent hydrolase [Flavobacteriaceae bacterium]|jgi:inner membrane protein|nr:metal-dependent hydrolase [Flavobacteriaceae bacterium]